MLFFYTSDNFNVYCMEALTQKEFLSRLKAANDSSVYTHWKQVPASCMSKLFPYPEYRPCRVGDVRTIPRKAPSVGWYGRSDLY